MKLTRLDDGMYQIKTDPKESFNGAYNTIDGPAYSGELIESLIEQYQVFKTKKAPKLAWKIDGDKIIDTETGVVAFSNKWEFPPLDCLCVIMNEVYERVRRDQTTQKVVANPQSKLFPTKEQEQLYRKRSW